MQVRAVLGWTCSSLLSILRRAQDEDWTKALILSLPTDEGRARFHLNQFHSNRIFRSIAAAMLAALCAASPARAELHVTVDQGNAQPLPIAIPDFSPPNPADMAAGQNIAKVVRADLE